MTSQAKLKRLAKSAAVESSGRKMEVERWATGLLIFRLTSFASRFSWVIMHGKHMQMSHWAKKYSLERQFVLLAHSGCCWLISVFMCFLAQQRPMSACPT